jgi:hypothetical protein
MKSELGLVLVVLVVAAIALMVTLSARAGERRGDPDVVEVRSATAEDLAENAATIEAALAQEIDDAEAAAKAERKLLANLLELGPPGGLQLPPPAETDMADWQRVEAGDASMLLPPGWTVQNRLDHGDGEDVTVGLSPEALDIYVELRRIRNSDSNYRQTLVDHAREEYSRSIDRLKDNVILGYAPRAIDGALGGIEVMNQFGQERDEEGNPNFRLVLWRGRWEQDEQIHRVEFTATFAQDRHEHFAPLVSRILSTVEIDRDAPPSGAVPQS